MSDQSYKRSGTWWAIVSAAVLLPIFYTLSFAPAVRTAPQTRTAWRFVKAFYAPVFWLHDNTPLAGPLEWYVRKW